jgi:hypothetical protein
MRRKDPTPYERSKTLVRVAETARQVAQRELPTDEFRPTAGRNSRGRPP